MAPRITSSILGRVALVTETLSPSQLMPSGVQRILTSWTPVARRSGVGFDWGTGEPPSSSHTPAGGAASPRFESALRPFFSPAEVPSGSRPSLAGELLLRPGQSETQEPCFWKREPPLPSSNGSNGNNNGYMATMRLAFYVRQENSSLRSRLMSTEQGESAKTAA